MTKNIMMLGALLIAGSALAGDLTVDNLSVTKDTTIQGGLNVVDGPVLFDTPNGNVAMGAFTNRPISITGGTITNYTLDGTNYQAHIFLSSGNFKVSGCSLTCDVLVVAGGGGSGSSGGSVSGGGGAGGVIHSNGVNLSGSISVVIGAGGGGGVSNKGVNGGDSFFGTWDAIGGGGGSRQYEAGSAGGSGGGGGGARAGGAGVVGQGHDGAFQGGGGGFSSDGLPTDFQNSICGGTGIVSSISGISVGYAGGGASGGGSPAVGFGGGSGEIYPSNAGQTPGTPNTGGGGGGMWGLGEQTGMAGGSGIVIVRYQIP